MARRVIVKTADQPASTTSLSVAQRKAMAAELIAELFLQTSDRLLKWSAITGQSAQVDAGYIAQHLVSLVTGIPGIRRRGKGLDLIDNSEVKTANSVHGIDKPRWNLQFVREDTMEALHAHPFIFLVLFDHARDGSFRARIWGIAPATDRGFRTAFATWRASTRVSRNYQLHPPIGREDDIATNDSGNLRLPKMFEAIGRGGVLSIKLLHTRPTGESLLIGTGRWDRKSGLTEKLEEVSTSITAKTEVPPRRKRVRP